MSNLFGESKTWNVISLWQPWSMLWALGEKINETRHWQIPARYRNSTIYIHAAQKWNGELAEYCQMRYFKEAFLRHLDIVGEDVPDQIGVTYRMVRVAPGQYIKLPFGAVIGKVDVVTGIPTDHHRNYLAVDIREKEVAFGDYSPGRYAWVGGGHQVLPSYIPLKGAQGFFTYTPEVELAT